MSRRTTTYTSNEQSLPTEVLAEVTEVTGPDTEVIELSAAAEATSAQAPTAQPASHRRLPPGGLRRPGLYLAVAAAGAIVFNVLAGGEPDARADAAAETVTVADQLGLSSQQTDAALTDGELADRLGDLAAQRSQREFEQAAAVQVQAAADQAARDALAAEQARIAAEAQAAEEARVAAEQALAAEEARVAAEEARVAAEAQAAELVAEASTAPAPSASSGSGSFQDYALAELGGDQSEFSCLESLWGKESGWNPDAQNPTSTAYGIPQFLDSTWKGTGITKTSDGYRQIDAGLIYIDSSYGSPCGAWSHSKSTGWY